MILKRQLLLTVFLLSIYSICINAQSPISVGTKVVNAQLYDMEGKTIALENILENKITVIIFYRGSWCPFCNTHLSDLQGIEKSLKKKEVQLIAITPESWEKLNETKVKNFTKYPLYSDPDFEAISGFGIRSGNVPIPSAFIIDKEGIVRFVHANPDYKQRIDANTLLSEVEKVMQ
jgi:peroxiredoxin